MRAVGSLVGRTLPALRGELKQRSTKEQGDTMRTYVLKITVELLEDASRERMRIVSTSETRATGTIAVIKGVAAELGTAAGNAAWRMANTQQDDDEAAGVQ